ncbi:MAG: putative manganese-dependent inorganic diphosphatase [Chloroflexota bacterium]|nr:MAG: putative manganese-dependent inorganic diphosphatase [Chloroflexota bacterium]
MVSDVTAEPPTIVIGHRNPDTDAICAAIAYRDLLALRDQTDAVAARAGLTRPETRYLLERFGVPEPTLIEDMRQRVRDVMTAPARTVLHSDSLYEVGLRQIDSGMRPLPVLDGDGRLAGIAEAQDFAKVFFQGLDPSVADQVPIDFDNLVRALDARVIVRADDRPVRRTVMVAAWNIESIKERLQPDIVLVVGDRLDVQRAAIDLGVGMMIVTGGTPVESKIVAHAQSRGVAILTVDHHTATTLRLIHMSVPVSIIMRRDPPSCSPDDLVDEVRGLLGSERALSVVDDARRVVGVVTRADLLRRARRQVVLVDHNERSQAVEGIEQAQIVGIIDHHRVADLITDQPPMMRLEPVGACCTLIASLYREANLTPSPSMAGIMVGAIMIDTLLFQSPTTTAEDRATVAHLTEIAGIDAERLGRALVEIASDVSNRNAQELVLGDFKSFAIDGHRFGVGVIETGNSASVLARRSELNRALADIRGAEYTSTMLVVTDIVSKRTTVLVNGHAREIARALGGHLRGPDTIDLAGVYSRKKQIVPALSRVGGLIRR